MTRKSEPRRNEVGLGQDRKRLDLLVRTKGRLSDGLYFFMKYYTYILYSKKFDTFYKGQISNIHERLERHNAGKEKITAQRIPKYFLFR